MEACAEACETEGLDDCLMFVVDILNESATVLETTPSAVDIVTAAWPEVRNHTLTKTHSLTHNTHHPVKI